MSYLPFPSRWAIDKVVLNAFVESFFPEGSAPLSVMDINPEEGIVYGSGTLKKSTKSIVYTIGSYP